MCADQRRMHACRDETTKLRLARTLAPLVGLTLLVLRSSLAKALHLKGPRRLALSDAALEMHHLLLRLSELRPRGGKLVRALLQCVACLRRGARLLCNQARRLLGLLR